MERLVSIDKVHFPDRVEIITKYVYYGYLFVMRAFAGKYTIEITKGDLDPEVIRGNYIDYDYEKLIDNAKKFINSLDLIFIKQERKIKYGN